MPRVKPTTFNRYKTVRIEIQSFKHPKTDRNSKPQTQKQFAEKGNFFVYPDQEADQPQMKLISWKVRNFMLYLRIWEMILAFPRKPKQKEASRFVASEESDPTQIGENPPEKILL